jgi:hypothetical protein
MTVIITPFIFMLDIYNYVPEQNHASSVCGAAAIL